MKSLLIPSLAIVLLIVGCKKEPTNTAPKIYLLSQAIYNVTYGNGTKASFVDSYTYDAKLRLMALNSQFVGLNFDYTYDDHNNLLVATWYYPSGALYYTNYYSYSGSTVKDSSVYVGGSIINVRILSLNANGQVQSDNLNNQSTSDTYTYDSQGNVTGYNPAGGFNYTYTYDDKSNPLSMIEAKNIDLTYFFKNAPQTNVNNPLTGNSGETTYAYTYNSAGFPLTGNVQVNDPMVPFSYTVDFEYITTN